jgi:hypothetical protein
LGRAGAAEDIRKVASDRDRVRPLRKDAQTPTDFADDFEWAAMIAEESAPFRLDGVKTATMPRVGGRAFRCECGANVFTHDSVTDYFTCNGCGTVYEGTR